MIPSARHPSADCGSESTRSSDNLRRMNIASLLRPMPAALLLLLLPACSGSSGPIDGDQAMAHVKAQVAFGPRPAGSDALAKTADYLCGEIKALGLEPHRQEFTPPNEHFLVRNLWTQIDGDDPQHGPILCLGAHYDTKLADGKEGRQDIKFVGAIDGAGGPAVLLEVARELVKQKHKVNIWIYFIDAEESVDWEWGDGKRATLGSKGFAAAMQADKTLFPEGLRARMKAFVLLDLIGSKDIKIDRDGNSKKELQDLFLDAAKQMGEQDRVYLYKSPQGFGDDHQSFSNYGVPVVNLIDFMYRVPGQSPPQGTSYLQWWHTEQDDVANMSSEALAFVGNLVMQALPALEDWCLKK